MNPHHRVNLILPADEPGAPPVVVVAPMGPHPTVQVDLDEPLPILPVGFNPNWTTQVDSVTGNLVFTKINLTET